MKANILNSKSEVKPETTTFNFLNSLVIASSLTGIRTALLGFSDNPWIFNLWTFFFYFISFILLFILLFKLFLFFLFFSFFIICLSLIGVFEATIWILEKEIGMKRATSLVIILVFTIINLRLSESRIFMTPNAWLINEESPKYELVKPVFPQDNKQLPRKKNPLDVILDSGSTPFPKGKKDKLYFYNNLPVDIRFIFEKWVLKNEFRKTLFLVYFKLDFYCLLNLDSFTDSPCHILNLYANKEACHRVLLKLENYLRYGVLLL